VTKCGEYKEWTERSDETKQREGTEEDGMNEPQKGSAHSGGTLCPLNTSLKTE